MLDLDTVEVHGHVDASNDIRAIENTAAFLHVEELDGKNIGRGAQLVGGEKEWGWFVLVFAPPVNNRSDAG